MLARGDSLLGGMVVAVPGDTFLSRGLAGEGVEFTESLLAAGVLRGDMV